MREKFITILVVLSTLQLLNGQTVETPLASGKQAKQDIIISDQASTSVKTCANELATYLGKISGATFTIKTGTGQSGIAVGVADHFSNLPVKLEVDKNDPLQREKYLIKTHKDGIYILGATDLAVEDAVWDFLHRLGYRQYFPGKDWEIIPSKEELKVALDTVEEPDYKSRSMFYGFGTWKENTQATLDWRKRNRLRKGFELNSSHAYASILQSHLDEFKEHPEYLSLYKGKRMSTNSTVAKFCISNPDLRKLVVDSALAYFEKRPDKDSISMEPSDLGYWCECEECKKIGSVSDQALLLTNEVAKTVAEKYPGKHVGMYAYSFHAAPPTNKVENNVIIGVATSLIKGGFTAKDLLAGWQKKGAKCGIREYLSVTMWDRDQPGNARGSNVAYICKTIPEFYQLGARFYDAEASDNWGPNGLGYYLMSRLLWDVDEAEKCKQIVDEFISNCFKDSAPVMEKFYRFINYKQDHVIVPQDRIGRMYKLLDQALKLAKNPAEKKRIEDLILYTHFVELWFNYTNSGKESAMELIKKDQKKVKKSEDELIDQLDEQMEREEYDMASSANVENSNKSMRQYHFEKLIQFVYRIRQTCMVHSMGLYRDVADRDSSVHILKEYDYGVPEGKNPWKSSQPFSTSDIRKILDNGMKRFKPIDVQLDNPMYSHDLVPLNEKSALKEIVDLKGETYRGNYSFYLWVPKGRNKIPCTVTGGVFFSRTNDIILKLYEAANGIEGALVSETNVKSEKEPQHVELTVKNPGLYFLKVIASRNYSRFEVDPEIPIVSEAGFTNNTRTPDVWSRYFYIPENCSELVFYARTGGRTVHGSLINSSGKTVQKFTPKLTQEIYRIPVPKSERGKIWFFKKICGNVHLLTVPPFLSPSPKQLLIPKKVISEK